MGAVSDHPAAGKHLRTEPAPPAREELAAQEERLEDGCSPDTPAGDSVQRRFVLAQAARVEAEALAMGGRAVRTDDFVLGDRRLAHPVLNQCFLLRPVGAIGPDALAAAVAECGRDGSPFTLWSAWPTPDLRSLGLVLSGHPPLMYRPAGPPPAGTVDPPGLEVTEITATSDVGDYVTFARTAAEAFGLGGLSTDGEAVWDGRVAASGWRFWLGRLDGEPVATAAASTSHGVNVVEIISTLAAARGKGIGAAVTWRATLADPTLPAVLLASDLGRPVYERMGYVAVQRTTVWVGGAGGHG
jgi:hypothetical protein